jgi:putative ABC transport system permease protein
VIRHLFRLVWNRKRSSALIFAEMLVCFLVLCAVGTGVAFMLDNWHRPRGFEYRDTWHVQVGSWQYYRAPQEQRRDVLQGLRRVLEEARQLQGVEAAALMDNSPYSTSTSSWTFDIAGQEMDVQFGPATDDLPRALGLRLLAGRWFGEGDRGLGWVPVVISRNLALARFGNAAPLGERLRTRADADSTRTDFRVVGVFQDYRRHGEVLAAPFVGYYPARMDDIADLPPRELLVRVRPGTTASFERELLTSLQRVVPTWSLRADTLEHEREVRLRFYLLPLVILATLAGFLVLMVGFGLTGVLWQNVTRRTAELGLRRALGATSRAVQRQVLGEVLMIAALAMGLGALLFVQLPILRVLDFLPARVYVYGLAEAVALLFGLVALCGLYPSWMATRVQPAAALQHD